MSILEERDIKRIKSKAEHWNMLLKQNQTAGLKRELQAEVSLLDIKILFILENYIKQKDLINDLT